MPDFLCIALFVNEIWTQSKCQILEELMTLSLYDRTLHNLYCHVWGYKIILKGKIHDKIMVRVYGTLRYTWQL